MRVRCHAKLCKFAFGHHNLAAAANTAPAADRIDIDAKLARSGQDRCAAGESTALARRHKDEPRMVAVFSAFIAVVA